MARRFLALAALALLAAGCGATLKQPSASDKLSQGKTRPKLTVRQIATLPQTMSKASAVAPSRGRRLLILGGLVGDTSLSTIYELAGSLRVLGSLPQPTHDAAAVRLHGSVYLFGGGSSVSSPYVVRVNPATGAATNVKPLGESLSDLGAVAIGGKAYLVGGYTGTEFASAIVEYPSWRVIARLPHGTRYAGVAAIGRTIYVAGGLTTAGATRDIYAVTLGGKRRLIGKLPKPEAHAALAALGGTLYLVGGRKVLAINPVTGKVTTAAKLPASLSDPTASAGSGQIIVTGGGTNGVWALKP